jgi:hypothetical protein
MRPGAVIKTRLPSLAGFEARQAVLHPWPRASPARDGRELERGAHRLPSIERSSHGAQRGAVRSPCDAGISATLGACRGCRTSGYRALISTELARHELVPMEGGRGALARNRRSGEKPGCANVASNPDGRSRYTLEDQSRESATNPFSPPGGATWRQSIPSRFLQLSSSCCSCSGGCSASS